LETIRMTGLPVWCLNSEKRGRASRTRARIGVKKCPSKYRRRTARIDYLLEIALTNSSGFGGTNVAIILRQ
jgi:3-oxoacyl-(acyl-carrier-protein) synthase